MVEGPRNGYYEITVEKEECGRLECVYEAWRARIDCETYDNWDDERDPSRQRKPISWEDFKIDRV